MRNTSRVARNAVSQQVVALEREGAKFEDVRELVAGVRGKVVYETGDRITASGRPARSRA